MRPKPPANYLAGYPNELSDKVRLLIQQGVMAERLLQKYPQQHSTRTDKALYEYVIKLKNQHLRKSGPLNKVTYDNKLHIIQNALGMHSSRSQVHGGKLKAKREIRVSTLFKEMPEAFLRMIVVHELAHIKECEHNKAFYQLCQHMEPDYHHLELDVRVYLTYLDAGGENPWSPR